MRPARRPLTRRRRTIFFAALAVAFAAGAFVLAEGVARLVLSWKMRSNLELLSTKVYANPEADIGYLELIHAVDDDNLVYRMKPGTDAKLLGHRVQINSLGMRDEEVGPKPAGGVRIVALGDSHMFGWGIELTETFPKLLERSLGDALSAGPPVEVLNAGVPGYTALMEAEWFERDLLGLQPDALIVQFCLNDGLLPGMLWDRPYLTRLTQLYLPDLLKLLRTPEREVLTIPEVPFIDTAPGLYRMDESLAPDRYRQHMGWEAVDAAWERMARLCRARGIPMLGQMVIEVPWEGEGYDSASVPYFTRFKELCARLDIPVIDPFPAAEALADRYGLDPADLTADPPMNLHGNAIANTLYTRLALPPLAERLDLGGLDDSAIQATLDRLDAQLETLATAKSQGNP